MAGSSALRKKTVQRERHTKKTRGVYMDREACPVVIKTIKKYIMKTLANRYATDIHSLIVRG